MTTEIIPCEGKGDNVNVRSKADLRGRCTDWESSGHAFII